MGREVSDLSISWENVIGLVLILYSVLASHPEGCFRIIYAVPYCSKYMTKDKCVYEVCVESSDVSVAVRDYVEGSNYDDSFSAEVVDERSDDGGVVFTIEVHGDAYEIPVLKRDLLKFLE